MIGPQDLCLLISNSGETAELKDMIAHTRRFSIPMAAISSNGASTLSKAATFKLTLPDAPEACPIGLAPTTSTTLALALGDALAVALMQQRNFRAENFQTFHPGGKLGAQMMRAGQLMHGPEKLPIVSAKSSMADTLLEMTSKGFGVAALIENDRLTGLISDGDLRRHMQGLMDKTAADIASPTPITIAEDDFAADALRIMNTHKISVLIVVDNAGTACGILHIHDLLRAGVA
jgi:arabinose-5-phosphate isomerase